MVNGQMVLVMLIKLMQTLHLLTQIGTAGECLFSWIKPKEQVEVHYGTNWYNFGNGYFQTTAVSNAGTNASNNGIFEYDVPTGFTALSTKGLNL